MRRGDLGDTLRLVWLARLSIAGRWTFALVFAPIIWPLLLAVILLLNPGEEGYRATAVGAWVLGPAIAALGIGLGVRIVASEIEQRTIELAYTVPGGAQKIWYAKLTAAVAILVLATLVGGLFTVLLTAFPWWVLLDVFLAGVTFLTLSMWLSVVTRSEVTGALVAVPLLVLALLLQETRVSPFFTTVGLVESGEAPLRQIVAWSTQNRIGQLLVSLGFVLMANGAAERREKLLG